MQKALWRINKAKSRKPRLFVNRLCKRMSLRQNRLFRLYLILYVLMVLLPFTFLLGLQQYSQQLSTSLNDTRPMLRDYLIGSMLQNSSRDAADTAKDLIRFGIYLTAPYRAACVRYGSDDEREQAHGTLNELIDEDVQLCAIYSQRSKELILLISGRADGLTSYNVHRNRVSLGRYEVHP